MQTFLGQPPGIGGKLSEFSSLAIEPNSTGSVDRTSSQAAEFPP
jgi:hypothetical protein